MKTCHSWEKIRNMLVMNSNDPTTSEVANHLLRSDVENIIQNLIWSNDYESIPNSNKRNPERAPHFKFK